MVFQSGALFDSLTVGENILFSLELREDYDQQNKEDVVRGLLEMVDLADYENVYPTDLSTGHRRAVAIAEPWQRNQSAFFTTNRRPWWTRSCRTIWAT